MKLQLWTTVNGEADEMLGEVEVDDEEWRVRARHAMRTTLREQLRTDLDAIATRLGYHRDDNCPGDDW